MYTGIYILYIYSMYNLINLKEEITPLHHIYNNNIKKVIININNNRSNKKNYTLVLP